MTRPLIIGATGFIGSALARHLPDAIRTIRASGELVGDWPFDLADPGPLPDAAEVYLCAGVNGTLTCARDPQGSFRVNVDGTIHVAERYRHRGFVVWLSSTTVEWASGAYADQKRYAESVLRTMPHVGIIRAGRVTADNVDDLARTMIATATERRAGVTLWGEDEKPYVRAGVAA